MNCTAVVTIKGETFPCTWPTNEFGKHYGWGHSNKAAEVVWRGRHSPSTNQPRFLCYTDCESRAADIVHSKEEILLWLSEQWIGTLPDSGDDNWEPILEDLAPLPQDWGDGTAEIIWELEGGHVSVQFLSDHWDESWAW